MPDRAPAKSNLRETSTSDNSGMAEGHEAVVKRRTLKRRKKWLIRIGAAFFILAWVGFIPGFVAKRVFDDKEVEIRAKSKHGQNWLEEQERRSAHKLRVTGFRNNHLTVVFLFSYFALAGIWLVLTPRNTAIRGFWRGCRVFVYGLVAYLPMLGWSILRNLKSDDPRRTVVSYVNWDIWPSSGVLQELIILGIFLLLSVIWDKWTHYAKTWKLTMWLRDLEYVRRHCAKSRALAAAPSGTVSEDLRPTNLIDQKPAAKLLVRKFLARSRRVSHVFVHWQIVSFCIVVALLPWTCEYWLNIIRDGDVRYVNSAATMHAAYAITWFIVTIPLWRSMQAWSWLRERLLLEFSDDGQHKWVGDLKPVGDIELFTTAIVAGLSFFIPIFKAFLG